ncbi:MAG TPA: acyl carrier protein [Clostridiales bacterium]|jgi:acyl carrier protein|nr:acyl carrier protein [Clostridiales bacterium]
MVLDKVIKILADYKGMSADKITAESTFSDLGLDSLDIVELIMTLEDEFNISLEINEELTNVGAVAKLIEEKVN